LDVGAAGKAEGLMAQEEWEEAVRVLESAWERARGEDVSAIFNCNLRFRFVPDYLVMS
jgi:hypothetical protein